MRAITDREKERDEICARATREADEAFKEFNEAVSVTEARYRDRLKAATQKRNEELAKLYGMSVEAIKAFVADIYR